MGPHLRRPQLSYANVTATLALFVAVSGGAYATGLIDGHLLRNGSVTAVKLQAHTLTGRQINLRKLGTVPSATRAVRADRASHASTADTATHANSADSAGNATMLGGQAPSAFLGAGAQAVDSARLGGELPGAYAAAGFPAGGGVGVAKIGPTSVPAGGSTTIPLGSFSSLKLDCDSGSPPSAGQLTFSFASGSGTIRVAVVMLNQPGSLSTTTAAKTHAINFTDLEHFSFEAIQGGTVQEISLWPQPGPGGQSTCSVDGTAVTAG